MGMSAFRRSAAHETKNKGGKGGKGAWFEKMRLPKIEPTPIIIMRGAYVDPNPPEELKEINPQTGLHKPVLNDYYKYRKHKRAFTNNGKEQYRDEPCSAGSDPHNPQPCVGCAAMDAGDKSVGVSDAYVFGLVHLIPYHTHPLVDWQTKQIKTKQDGSPILTYAECAGRLCNFCRVTRGEQPVITPGTDWAGWQQGQITTTFGHRRYLELGKSHLSNLEGFDNIVSSLCGTCRSQLSTEGYGCETCNSLVIDMSVDQRSDEQIAEAVSKLYPCMTCNRGVLLKESVTCEACEVSGRTFRQDNLFNSVIYLFRQGEGTKSQIMMQRHQSLDELGALLTSQGWLRDGKTIHQLIQEVGQPYDFAEIFKPRSAQEQQKKLGMVPAQGGQPQYGAYGAQPQYNQQAGQPPQQQYQQYPPQQQNFMPPPGQVPQPQQQYQQYPPQQQAQGAQGYAPPGPGTPVQQNGQGPAPFQPVGRPNFGS